MEIRYLKKNKMIIKYNINDYSERNMFDRDKKAGFKEVQVC